MSGRRQENLHSASALYILLSPVRLQEEYEQSVRLKEESQKADKLERQKAFQDVFAADMQHYKTHGEMERK